jgi:CrcB protein
MNPQDLSPSKPEIPSAAFFYEAIAIASGGALGACLRHGISLVIQAGDQHLVWSTTAVNFIGAFLLGLIVARVDSAGRHPLLRPFLVVGVFGSFTTFSALALDNRALAGDHGEGFALVHLGGSVLLGLLAFGVGTLVARDDR